MKKTTPLLVTIDTECDKSPNWRTSSPLTFHGVTIGIPIILQPLFREFGVRPTYLVSYEVMDRPECVDVLQAQPDAELGTHLHGEYVPPGEIPQPIDGTLTSEMQWDSGYLLEKAKLATLTEKDAGVFGRRPRAFRAGRFGAGPDTGRCLMELGYAIDSSVTPHLSWESRLGYANPDFRACPELPYRIGADGNLFTPGTAPLLELPVTLAKLPQAPDQPAWFRPWISPRDTLASIIDHVARGNQDLDVPRPLVMMFHNMEVFPAASPYPQTILDVDAYVGALRHTFTLIEEYGLVPMTMSDYFDQRVDP